MKFIIARIKHFFYNKLIPATIFKNTWRERMSRQEFYFEAFRALAFNGIDGEYVEFGSCGGKTFSMAYHHSRRQKLPLSLWSFDSFEGLPTTEEVSDIHPRWVGGTMKTGLSDFHSICKANGIPEDRYHVVSGFYDHTLPKFSPTDEPKNICLAYIDCDLYSSTKTVLEFLESRIKHGMIIAFDDYYCWSKTDISGERKAMLEFLEKNSQWQLVPYMKFGWAGMSFVVEVVRPELK